MLHTLILTIIFSFSISSPVLATYPDKLINKAEKLAGKNFKEIKVIKEPVQIDQSPYYNEQTDTVFKLLQEEGELIGFLVISSAKGRFEYFDFMMVYNTDPSIAEINILVYRSEYGFQVSARGWLNQFLKYPAETEYKYGQNIDAITGATFSGKSLTDNINRLNLLIGTLTR